MSGQPLTSLSAVQRFLSLSGGTDVELLTELIARTSAANSRPQ